MLDTPSGAVTMKLVDSNTAAEGNGVEPLPARSNYFIGRNAAQWRTGVPNFGRVRYENVYPGISLVYYGSKERRLEYDFEVAPGADPRRIALRFEANGQLRQDANGDLLVPAPSGEFRQRRPVAYQAMARAARK